MATLTFGFVNWLENFSSAAYSCAGALTRRRVAQ
jgi:hypothetical protein